jgi:hypothetical protein
MAKRKAKIGRPGYPPELWDEVTRRVGLGMSYNRAAISLGIDQSTISKKKKSDPDFFIAIKKADDECEFHHIQRVAAGDKNWQSSSWMLERKFNRWRDRARKTSDDEKPNEAAQAIVALFKTAVKPDEQA